MTWKIFSTIITAATVIIGILKFLSTFNHGSDLVGTVVTEKDSDYMEIARLQKQNALEFNKFCLELVDCNKSAWSLHELHLMAEKGDHSAIKYLSLIYTFGYQFYKDEPRINPNFEKGLHYSHLLLDQGDITALYHIAIAYKIGDKKVPQNIAKGIGYLIEFIEKSTPTDHAEYRAKALSLIMDSYLRKIAPDQINANNIEIFKPLFVTELSRLASQGKVSEIGQLSQVYFALSSDITEKMTAYGWSKIGLKTLGTAEITEQDKLKYMAMFENDIAKMEKELSQTEIQKVKQIVDEWQKGEIVTKALFE